MTYLWQKDVFTPEELASIKRSRETMNLEALTTLGLFYAYGKEGYTKNSDQATIILNMAMAKKHAQAFYVYAHLVMNPHFKGAIDEAKSVAYLKKAAELGFDLAMARLGEYYLDGVGLKKNMRDAERWLIKARCKEALPGLARIIEHYKSLGYEDKVSELTQIFDNYKDVKPISH